MSDPLLQREAEVPRTRSTGGAIVVAVAFFSLFTALGASAFVIRVRALASRSYAAHAFPQRVELAEPPAPVLAYVPDVPSDAFVQRTANVRTPPHCNGSPGYPPGTGEDCQ